MKQVSFVAIDGSEYAAWWRERFSPPSDPFAEMSFYQRGRANIWVGTADIERLGSTRTDAVGIHLLRIGRHLWKPTSAAIVSFGTAASINAIDLERPEALCFLAGEAVVLKADDARRDRLSRGFVAVRFHGAAIGCGDWHAQRGAVESCIPKSRQTSDLDL